MMSRLAIDIVFEKFFDFFLHAKTLIFQGDFTEILSARNEAVRCRLTRK